MCSYCDIYIVTGDKLAIISTLMNQLLSYASLRDIIEESMDHHKTLAYELKQIQWAEQRREREETQVKHKKRLELRLFQNQQIQYVFIEYLYSRLSLGFNTPFNQGFYKNPWFNFIKEMKVR